MHPTAMHPTAMHPRETCRTRLHPTAMYRAAMHPTGGRQHEATSALVRGEPRLMLAIVTPDEMAAIDEAAPEPVEVLIDRAAHHVAREAIDLMGGVYGRRVTVLAGPGNNGVRRTGGGCAPFPPGSAGFGD